VGDLYHDPGRLERADQPADHDHRGDWPLPLHAQPHLSWHGTGLIGLAIAFDSLWLLMTLVPFALVIRYGVITREEAYLERKFGDVYRRYHTRVRRWL
jgi:hypothetical protein